jgi:hypothetical protein
VGPEETASDRGAQAGRGAIGGLGSAYDAHCYRGPCFGALGIGVTGGALAGAVAGWIAAVGIGLLMGRRDRHRVTGMGRRRLLTWGLVGLGILGGAMVGIGFAFTSYGGCFDFTYPGGCPSRSAWWGTIGALGGALLGLGVARLVGRAFGPGAHEHES